MKNFLLFTFLQTLSVGLLANSSFVNRALDNVRAEERGKALDLVGCNVYLNIKPRFKKKGDCATLPTYDTPLITTLPDYWVRQDALTCSMPYGIEVYRSTTGYSYNAGPVRKLKAFCIVLDPKYVEFKPTYSATNKTPQSFIADEPGTVLACINAGFFGPDVAFSMLRYNGNTYAHNVASLNRTRHGSATKYYATRAAFGLGADLVPNVTWIYNISGAIYSYNAPSPNDTNEAPLPQPIAAGAVIWNTVSAVGGAPMLVKNSNVCLTETEEMIVVDNASPRARSAIGYTADGKVVLLAVEGENPGISDGLNLLELANYMKDMGCVGAINLDGGSSTVLRINNKEMIRPSSSGAERAMPGVILIKTKK